MKQFTNLMESPADALTSSCYLLFVSLYYISVISGEKETRDSIEKIFKNHPAVSPPCFKDWPDHYS